VKKKRVKQLARQMVLEFMELKGSKRVPRRRALRKMAAKKALTPEQVKAAADRAENPPERKPIVISDEVLQRSRQKVPRFQRVNPFKLPDFPVQLTDSIPADRRMAADEAINGISAWAGGAWSALGANVAFEGIAFLGYQYLAELAQRPEYRVIVETIATEMTRKWIRFLAKGDKDKTKKIEQLTAEFERLKVRENFCQACEIDGFFGRAHLYLDTGDTDDREELKTPIGNGANGVTDRKFQKGDLKRLAVVEPMWTYPTQYNSNNPLRPDWYNPQMWFVMDREVHISRLLKFVGREVPDALKPAYSFGGLSLTQMAKPYVENFLNIRQSVADIVQAFSVFVLSTNLGETLTPGGDGLFKRADLFNNLRDNRGIMMVDAEQEEFQNVAAPLSSLDALQAQAQEHMASVSRIPLVKLLGTTPHGLNATAEPELRAFYDSIGAFQLKFFSPNLDKVFHFAQLNIWGKVDPDLSYVYEPLWSLDEKGQAEVDKLEAETAQIDIDSGAIAPVERRTVIVNKPNSPYAGLDPDDIPDLLEEEEEGLEPKGAAAKLAEGGEQDQHGESEPQASEREDA
jgi:phage-related protein (TIGR01555 family)